MALLRLSKAATAALSSVQKKMRPLSQSTQRQRFSLPAHQQHFFLPLLKGARREYFPSAAACQQHRGFTAIAAAAACLAKRRPSTSRHGDISGAVKTVFVFSFSSPPSLLSRSLESSGESRGATVVSNILRTRELSGGPLFSHFLFSRAEKFVTLSRDLCSISETNSPAFIGDFSYYSHKQPETFTTYAPSAGSTSCRTTESLTYGCTAFPPTANFRKRRPICWRMECIKSQFISPPICSSTAVSRFFSSIGKKTARTTLTSQGLISPPLPLISSCSKLAAPAAVYSGAALYPPPLTARYYRTTADAAVAAPFSSLGFALPPLVPPPVAPPSAVCASSVPSPFSLHLHTAGTPPSLPPPLLSAATSSLLQPAAPASAAASPAASPAASSAAAVVRVSLPGATTPATPGRDTAAAAAQAATEAHAATEAQAATAAAVSCRAASASAASASGTAPAGGAFFAAAPIAGSLWPRPQFSSILWITKESRRCLGARTRRQREEMERKAEQQRNSQLTAAQHSAYWSYPPSAYNNSSSFPQQQVPPAGASTGLSIGWQLAIAFFSSIAFYIGFVMMMRLFGGHRVVAVHVDQYGRPVDPTTGQPR